MKALQERWKRFQDEHMPLLDKNAKHDKKFKEEAQEFDKEPSAEEAADCIIVLMSWANAHDVDLEAAVLAKIEKNEKRKWEFVGGVYKHIKEV